MNAQTLCRCRVGFIRHGALSGLRHRHGRAGSLPHHPDISTTRSSQLSPAASPSFTSSSTPTQRITNDIYGFQFLLPATWVVQSRSARNGVTYESLNHLATVGEFGTQSGGLITSVATFVANQWRFNIPPKSHMSYFAQGSRGAWAWLSRGKRIRLFTTRWCM